MRRSERQVEEGERRQAAAEDAKQARATEAVVAAQSARAGAAAATVGAGRDGGAGSRGEPQRSEPGARSGGAAEGEEKDSYEVEEVLRWRGTGPKREALVRWAGVDEADLPWKASWEPEENVSTGLHVVPVVHEKVKEAGRRRRWREGEASKERCAGSAGRRQSATGRRKAGGWHSVVKETQGRRARQRREAGPRRRTAVPVRARRCRDDAVAGEARRRRSR